MCIGVPRESTRSRTLSRMPSPSGLTVTVAGPSRLGGSSPPPPAPAARKAVAASAIALPRAGTARRNADMLAIPGDRPLEAVVQVDAWLPVEQLPRLVDVRDPHLDVRVVERPEDDLRARVR